MPDTEKTAKVYKSPSIAVIIGGIIALGISQGVWRLGDSLESTLPIGVFSLILVTAIPCLIGGLAAGVFAQKNRVLMGLFAGLIAFAGSAIIDISDGSVGDITTTELISTLLFASMFMAISGAAGGLLNIALRRMFAKV